MNWEKIAEFCSILNISLNLQNLFHSFCSISWWNRWTFHRSTFLRAECNKRLFSIGSSVREIQIDFFLLLVDFRALFWNLCQLQKHLKAVKKGENKTEKSFSLIGLPKTFCPEVKVSKFQKFIFLFSLPPKTERNYFLISALMLNGLIC